jgi:cell division inhibitor SepF
MKVRLGLEDEYDDEYYDEEGYESDEEYEPRRAEPPSPYGPGTRTHSVSRVDRSPDLDRARSAQLRSVPVGAASVTPAVPQVKMHIVEPKSFDEAGVIADKFKQGIPVIMRLTLAKPDLVRRYIDFASGLTYGLDGGLQKIDEKVFMLTPHNVEVSDADRRRARGVFNAE